MTEDRLDQALEYLQLHPDESYVIIVNRPAIKEIFREPDQALEAEEN